MFTILELHRLLSQTTWLFFLALGLWGGYRAIRGQGVDGSYLGAAAIGEGLFLIQAVLGGLLYLQGGRPERSGIHLLYGTFGLLFLPFIYFVVLRGEDSNRAQWVLSFSTLFLFGIALRAIGTGV